MRPEPLRWQLGQRFGWLAESHGWSQTVHFQPFSLVSMITRERVANYLSQHNIISLTHICRSATFRPVKHLSESEMEKLLVVAEARSRRNWLALLVGYNHGLRVSEIIGLRAKNVVDGFLTVKRLKGSERTSQPLVASERTALEGFCTGLRPNDRLFPVSRVMMHKVFKQYCALAGIPRIPGRGIHALKHSIAMHSIKIAGIEAVRVYLGHKSLSSTGAYLKISDGEASSAVQGAIGRKLETL